MTQRHALLALPPHPHKHVAGELEVALRAETRMDGLKAAWRAVDEGPVGVLARSRAFREKAEGLSEKVDQVLDTYWNKLEGNAKDKVDRQLVEYGLVKMEEEPLQSSILFVFLL